MCIRDSSMLSVNTNGGAMIALQYLNQTQGALTRVQNAINRGMSVASAKDDGATFAIAQNMRSDVAGFTAVTDSLNRGMSSLSLIHISEPTRLLSISYAVFCLKKKKK